MDAVVRDLRYALRTALRQPLLTLVVVATLALGIGANTAIFSVLHAVLLRPLPYAQPERLVTIWQDLTRIDGPHDEWASWENFQDWRRESRTFSSMSAINGWRPTLAGDESGVLPEQVRGGATTWDIFETLGVEPLRGRRFTAEDDRPKAAKVALVSEAFWQRRFGAQQELLGSSLVLDEESIRIVGVLPRGFALPFVGEIDLLRPLAIDRESPCRGCVNLRVVGRLAPGVAQEQAQDEMSNLALALEEQYPEENTGVGSTLIPLHDRVTGQMRTPLLVLVVAVGLVLLVACANVASVQLARALARREELSLRLALGARRAQLVRQLLLESIVLALLGGGAGLAVAGLGVRALRQAAADTAPRLAEAGLDATTLGFAVAMTLLTGILFGALPAFRASGTELRAGIQQGTDARGPRRLRAGLVVVEVALAVVLLLGAGLLTRSLFELFQVDLGFDPERVLVARVSLATDSYRESASRVEFSETVVERLAAMPGIQAVGHTLAPPLMRNDADSNFLIEGRPDPEPGREPVLWLRPVHRGYFGAAGIGLVEGRRLAETDRPGAPEVVLINESAARRYWPNGDHLGARISFNSNTLWREVVGVVEDTRHWGLVEPARPAVYVPYSQAPFGAPYFVVKTEGDPLARTSDLRAAVAEVDPALAVAEVTTFGELVGRASATERLLVWLLALFASSALLLAAIGLYGVTSYSMEQRRREMGIRLALGAAPGAVRRMLVLEGLALVLVGAVLGIAVAGVASRGVASLLYEISVFDLATWVVVPVLLVGVGALATWIPALRAGRLDIAQTLRSD